ncbi:S1 family peptidase [Streptomyces sp. NPDC056661]|uniref:S1 family peptidase n=1 Tax=Streptomyces sp. NPDC056661 TaxID=3345898 RepID=UPI00368DB6FC
MTVNLSSLSSVMDRRTWHGLREWKQMKKLAHRGSYRFRLMAMGSMSCLLFALTGTESVGATHTDIPEKTPISGPGPRGPVPAGFATWNALFAEQDRLSAVSDRISKVAAGHDGFGGLIVAPENHEVLLYWKGALPTAVQNAITESQETAPVRTLSAAYSLTELNADVAEWIESGQVMSAGPEPDASGLWLDVPKGGPAPELHRPAGTTAPFRVEVTDSNAPKYSRDNDVSPYYGGGRTINFGPGGERCSTGYAIEDADGLSGMFTAAHCGDANNKDIIADGGGQPLGWDYMGKFAWEIPERDIAIITTDSDPFVFTGSPTSSSGRAVLGYITTWPGMYVCTSGATSGEHCGIKVTAAEVTQWVSGQKVMHLINAESPTGGCAVAAGDSGGPVYSYTSGGQAVNAHGTISTGSPDVISCGSNILGGYRVSFPRISDTLPAFKAKLYVYTGPI